MKVSRFFVFLMVIFVIALVVYVLHNAQLEGDRAYRDHHGQ